MTGPTTPEAHPPRVLALWVPDWPVIAATTVAEIPPHLPAAVHDGHRLVAVSALARARGVRRGMRRRQAQEVCPDLVLLARDVARDVRAFEAVARAAEAVVAGVEVTRPGLLLLPEAGAGRYHGSTEALAERLVTAVAEAGHEALVGVADGVGAAVLAARAGVVVPPGGSRDFLAPRGIGELRHVAAGEVAGADGSAPGIAELVDLLGRLGLRTLGDLAALPADSVAARFGALGSWAHRVAAGRDDRPTALRRPEPDVAVGLDLDPPAERVEAAAFAARRAAEALHTLLVERGVGCGRLRITARTEAGATLERAWRVEAALGGLSVGRVTDRVRWQLEGWLTTAARRPRADDTEPEPGAIVHLGLAAEEVVALGAEQGRLWGGHGGADLRAHRALHRVQGLVGDRAVLGVTVQGGRDLRDQVRLIPWGQEAEPPRPTDAPWPGRLPAPAPATVHVTARPVEVLGADGAAVAVDVRLRLSAEPARVRWVADGDTADVVGWAGPWPVVQRWWTGAGTRRVYLQAALADGRAVLLALEGGRWAVEADYD